MSDSQKSTGYLDEASQVLFQLHTSVLYNHINLTDCSSSNLFSSAARDLNPTGLQSYVSKNATYRAMIGVDVNNAYYVAKLS